jgi:hypothetical protein
MSASKEWYFNMIQAHLDLAKSALTSGYVARTSNLIEVIIADCKVLLEELGARKESKRAE